MLYAFLVLGNAVAIFLWHQSRLNLKKSLADLAQAQSAMQQAEAICEERLKQKRQLLAHLSHELRTPMNGVLGMLSALKETALSHEQAEYVEVAYKSGDTLLSLINDILDFSKMREGKLLLEQLNFNLRAAIDEVLKLLGYLSEHKNIRLNFIEKNTLPERVKGDPTRLKQILYNLIGNAIKFTEYGFIQLTAELLPSQDKNLRLKFEVIDTGIGIKPEQLEKIFEQFSQADASIARQYGGTGLGLALCKQLTHMMGGDLQVTSEYGKGSNFSFTLILAEADADAVIEQKSQWVHTKSSTCSVLIVEDNEVNQMVAASRLKKMGCTITSAENGQMALSKLKNQKFDLILMDCEMPMLDGYETTRIFRAWEMQHKIPEEYQTPIIAMTAHALPEDKEKCLAAGMNDYMTKPINDADLDRILKDYLKAVIQ